MDVDQKGPGKNKRKSTEEADRELIYALFEMVNEGKKMFENGFKLGFLRVIEGVLDKKLSRCGIKDKPHIESRIKTLKKNVGTVFDIVNGVGCSGFGWDPNTNMVVAEKQVWDGYVQLQEIKCCCRATAVQLIREIGVSPHYDMLCTIFGKDRATRKDAVIVEDFLEEVSKNKSVDTQNLSVEEIDAFSNASTNDEGSSHTGKKRKNIDESLDAFRETAVIIGTKIEEATKKFSRALGVDLDIAQKRDKINDELLKVPNISRVERYQAMFAIARDHEVTVCFFTLEDDEKEDFVRVLLNGDLRHLLFWCVGLHVYFLVATFN